jgi:hypothetical protein
MGEWMYISTFSWTRYYLEVIGQLHVPATLPPEKMSPVLIDRTLRGYRNRSGRHWEEKILDPTGTRILTLGRPARSQSLYRLLWNRRIAGTCTNNSSTARIQNIKNWESLFISVRAHLMIALKILMWRNETLRRIALCSLVADYKGFGETYYLYLQDKRGSTLKARLFNDNNGDNYIHADSFLIILFWPS